MFKATVERTSGANPTVSLKIAGLFLFWLRTPIPQVLSPQRAGNGVDASVTFNEDQILLFLTKFKTVGA
jgi:hypothetical protein